MHLNEWKKSDSQDQGIYAHSVSSDLHAVVLLKTFTTCAQLSYIYIGLVDTYLIQAYYYF